MYNIFKLYPILFYCYLFIKWFLYKNSYIFPTVNLRTIPNRYRKCARGILCTRLLKKKQNRLERRKWLLNGISALIIDISNLYFIWLRYTSPYIPTCIHTYVLLHKLVLTFLIMKFVNKSLRSNKATKF